MTATPTDIVYCPPDVDCPCYARLTAEVERLRAALNKIGYKIEENISSPDLSECIDIARAALDKAQETKP